MSWVGEMCTVTVDVSCAWHTHWLNVQSRADQSQARHRKLGFHQLLGRCADGSPAISAQWH